MYIVIPRNTIRTGCCYYVLALTTCFCASVYLGFFDYTKIQIGLFNKQPSEGENSFAIVRIAHNMFLCNAMISHVSSGVWQGRPVQQGPHSVTTRPRFVVRKEDKNVLFCSHRALWEDVCDLDNADVRALSYMRKGPQGPSNLW